jgi:hypothetical protein
MIENAPHKFIVYAAHFLIFVKKTVLLQRENKKVQ